MRLFLLYLNLSNVKITKESNFITCRDIFYFYRQALLKFRAIYCIKVSVYIFIKRLASFCLFLFCLLVTFVCAFVVVAVAVVVVVVFLLFFIRLKCHSMCDFMDVNQRLFNMNLWSFY